MYVILKQNGKSDWAEVVSTDNWKDAVDFCIDLGNMRAIFEDEFENLGLPVNTEFAFEQLNFPYNFYIVIHERWSSWHDDENYYNDDRYCDRWHYHDDDPIEDYYQQRAEDAFWTAMFSSVEKMMAEYAPNFPTRTLADRKNVWYTGVLEG